jgi:hypothetical protein
MNATYLKYEVIRTLRNRQGFIFSLAFPLVMFFLIAGPNKGDQNFGNSGIPAVTYYMVGLIAFGTIGAVMSGGARISVDRAGRGLVSGYRDGTMGNELAAAREVLRAAGISAILPGAIDSVGASESELFAWAVREAVTNVVRHSRAHRCEVRLSEHAIEIVDDGVGSAAAAGNGLTGLRERVNDAGGRLTVEPNSALGGFRLRVEARA